MKKIYLFLVFSILCSGFLFSQHNQESCLTDKFHKKELEENPQYAKEYHRIQKELRNYLKSGVGLEARSSEVYTIPIVVHVMHLGESVGTGTNISDAQIQSAIDNMNDAFKNEAPYTGFNSNIQFVLAKRDPECNPSTGIVRVNASGVSDYSASGIIGSNQVAVKDLSRWPNTDYYNVWVVSQIEGNGGGAGIQGYAYYPGAPASVDGTVILYNAMGYDPDGTIGYNLKTYTRRNVTLTHELGHGLNLKHTFEGDEDGAVCPPNDNPETDGDEVADTPAHNRNDGNCGATGLTCAGPGNDLADVVTNFMAYSSEICQTKFSQGQVDRMRAALEISRPSLITSRGGLVAEGAYAGPSAASCSPQTQDLSNHFGGILSTSLNGRYITSGSALSDGGYVDFTENCNAYFELNTSEEASVEVKVFEANYQQLHVWIDWNGDGEFSGDNELQYSALDIEAGF
jgi:hypothetical protein